MKLIADQESAWAILLLMKYFMKKNPNAKKRDVAVKNRIQGMNVIEIINILHSV